MAGGVRKPVNIFRLKDLGEPEGVFNWRLWFAVVSFGLLGASRGTDEGLISGAFNSPNFKDAINYSTFSEVDRANIKANVSSMVQIGSVGGALIAFIVCDRIGRIMATRFLCLLWVLGISIFMIGGSRGNLGAIYAGRFIAGLGVGQTSVVGPVYIAEVAPASVRGLCTCFFSGAVYIGIVTAYFVNYGCALHFDKHSQNRWLIPTSLHIMLSGLIFCLSFFQLESPRFLIKQGKRQEAIQVMSKLRHLATDDAYVVNEISHIQAALDHELEATEVGWKGKIKELCQRRNLYCLYLASMLQLLSQWSGAGSITLYAPDLFKILGITGSEEGLLVTAVFGIVKLVSAVCCALFLVDVIGRKRSLILGITLQSLSMCYIAAYLTVYPQLGVIDDFKVPAEGKAASRGAIAMIYTSGAGWALGWNSMHFLLTAEVFPLQIRALANSWAMALYFANQYGNSRAMPNMLLPLSQGGISPRGTFWCLAIITLVGGIWVFIFVPETAGRTLEDMDRLFELPWYKIGLFGNTFADAQEEATVGKEQEEDDKADDNNSQHVERTQGRV